MNIHKIGVNCTVMLNKQIILLFIASFLFNSCLQRKSMNEEPEKFSLEEKDSTIENSHSHPIVFGEELIHYDARSMTSEEYKKYQVQKFVFAPEMSDDLYVIETKFPDHTNYYSRLICFSNSNLECIWLANYNKSNDQYIDSRRVYYKEEVGWSDENLIFYTFYYSDEKQLQIIDNQCRSSVEVVIHDSGKFEEFSRYAYDTSKIAIQNCVGNGLSGKFLPGETWTTIGMNPNADDEFFVKQFVAQNNYLDSHDRIVTLFIVPNIYWGEYFDLAFIGTYPDDHFELLKMEQADIEEYSHIKEQIYNAADPKEYGKDFTTIITDVKSYIFKGEKYWFIQRTDDLGNDTIYLSLYVITPDGELSLLSAACTSNYYLLRVGDKTMLYIEKIGCQDESDSSDLNQSENPLFRGFPDLTESTHILYQIDNDNYFTKVYEGTRFCE